MFLVKGEDKYIGCFPQSTIWNETTNQQSHQLTPKPCNENPNQQSQQLMPKPCNENPTSRA